MRSVADGDKVVNRMGTADEKIHPLIDLGSCKVGRGSLRIFFIAARRKDESHIFI